jgi:tRNA(Phe) wybutosine-synthesizing methylase Tyw3
LGEGDISTGTAREIEVDTMAFPTLSTHSRTSYMVEESSCRGRPEDSVHTDIRGSMGY